MVSKAAIADAIADTLATATGIVKAQSYNELSESVARGDLPLLQVYWQSSEQDITSNTDRTTFRAVVRQTEELYHADVFCTQRANLAQDMSRIVTTAEALQVVLEAQDVKPYFGLLDGAIPAIKAFHWRMERVNFAPDNPEVFYPGVRIFITVRIF